MVAQGEREQGKNTASKHLSTSHALNTHLPISLSVLRLLDGGYNEDNERAVLVQLKHLQVLLLRDIYPSLYNLYISTTLCKFTPFIFLEL